MQHGNSAMPKVHMKMLDLVENGGKSLMHRNGTLESVDELLKHLLKTWRVNITRTVTSCAR